MELVALYKFVEVLVDAPAGAVLTFYTDLPGDALTARATVNIPRTNGRHPYRLSLPGSCMGKLYAVKITPALGGNFTTAIYEAKVYARVLGPMPSQWQWFVTPVLETPVGWLPVKLPIPETTTEWNRVGLPIPETTTEWNRVGLPIPETTTEWNRVAIPIPETTMEWNRVALPIPTTTDLWTEAKIPIPPSPLTPEWIQVPVDA